MERNVGEGSWGRVVAGREACEERFIGVEAHTPRSSLSVAAIPNIRIAQALAVSLHFRTGPNITTQVVAYYRVSCLYIHSSYSYSGIPRSFRRAQYGPQASGSSSIGTTTHPIHSEQKHVKVHSLCFIDSVLDDAHLAACSTSSIVSSSLSSPSHLLSCLMPPAPLSFSIPHNNFILSLNTR
ncbi:hypothetical protein B0F90DRAFT_298320 [Multifurca ochricompacta]|uniref:Uncharacterized protein n=1 Tax=Multifurca ochricompacta TaxID=376703 RepID=A0AAD4LW92_9AGAM|nr:hypothetical protein B0F90DRAFT_298320 [Multifurca ochricompacta]